MTLTAHDIARTIDASALKIDTTYADFEALVAACRQHDFGCAFIWQSYSADLAKALRGTTTEFGTSLAFPSGQEVTECKLQQARYFMGLGADQIDLVMNVGFLKSGLDDRVREEIAAVREATRGFSLKVIIEAMLLSDQQIVKACEIVRDCGCDYVKSGTGFSSQPTTFHHVALMKKTVGSRCKVKAAGGIRDVATLVKMYALGVDRFGIGCASAIKIMEEASAAPGGIEVPVLSIDEYARSESVAGAAAPVTY